MKLSIKTKHARKIKMNRMSGMTLKKYLATCYLGLRDTGIDLEKFDRYQERDIVSGIPRSYRAFYLKAKDEFSGYDQKLVNLTRYIKIARLSKKDPAQLWKRTSSYNVTNFVQNLKRELVSKPLHGLEKSVFQIKREKYLNQFKLNKVTRPVDLDESKEYFGVEVECLVSRELALDKIALDLKVKNLSIKSDGSIRCDNDDQRGVEFTILLKKDTFKADLGLFCKFLEIIRAKVNSSCGLHVHLDMRHKSTREVTTIAKRLGLSLPVLKDLVPKSRRENSYCRLGVSKRNGQRYFAINMTALKKYQTIEVRLHSGTVDFEKIHNWIQLLDLISSTKNGKPFESLEKMAVKLNMSAGLLEFYKKRLTKFSKDSASENSIGYEATRASRQASTAETVSDSICDECGQDLDDHYHLESCSMYDHSAFETDDLTDLTEEIGA